MTTKGGLTLTISRTVNPVSLERKVLGVLRVADFGVSGDKVPLSIITQKGGLIVGTGPNSVAQLVPSGVAGNTLIEDPTDPKGWKSGAPGSSGGVIDLYNDSGAGADIGTVIIINKGNTHLDAGSFKTTTVVGDRRVWGVVKDGDIPNGYKGKVAVGGTIEVVKVTGNVGVCQALIPSSSAGYAKASGGGLQTGLLGYALTAYTGGGNGTVLAFIKPDLSAAAAEVVVEGSTIVQTSAGASTLICGNNANRMILAFAFAASGAPGFNAAPTIGGVAMTQTGTDYVANSFGVRVYAMQNNGTGTLSIVGASISNGGSYGTAFIALSGVAASNPVGTLGKSTQVTAASLSGATSDAVPGDLVVGFVVSPGSTASITGRGSGQTAIQTAANWALELTKKTATQAVEPMTWTPSASVTDINICVPIRPL